MGILDISTDDHDYLVEIIEADLDRVAQHIDWLNSTAGAEEPDREQQLASSERHLSIGQALLTTIQNTADEVKSYIDRLIDEDLDRNRDHLSWLLSVSEEPDREQQIAESERAVQLAEKASKFFSPT